MLHALLYPFPYLMVVFAVMLLHEGGHFLVLRMFDIKVREFSIGFGKVLWSRAGSKSKTVFSLRLLPIGGMVHAAEKSGSMNDFYSGRYYLDDVSYKKKLAVAFAGPLANIVACVLCMSCFFFIYGENQITSEVVGLEPGGPAIHSGLVQGDVIVDVNGHPVSTFPDVTGFVLSSGGKPLQLTVEDKKGTFRDVVVTPAYVSNPGVKNVQVPHMGVVFGVHKVLRYGVAGSVYRGGVTSWQYSSTVLSFMREVVLGKLSYRVMSGPIGMVKEVHDTIDGGGMFGFWKIFAAFSLMVGTLNLLPILPFDGGRITVVVIEAISGRNISERIQMIYACVGLYCIFLTMMFGTFSDFLSLW